MDFKKEIKALIETKFMARAEDMDKLMPKLDDDDMVKLVDETEINENEDDITDEDWRELHQHMNEDNEIPNTVDTTKLKVDVAKFIDKLQLQQFDNILQKIDKPQEQAEIIAAFAERIGIPRAKLPQVIASIKGIAENTKKIITKDKLVEFITSKNKF